MVLLLVGFAFKVSAVPFHMWTPDAYQGAPTLVTGFMSTGVKAAAFAAFVRVFLSALEPLRVEWVPVLSAIAGLTMILGHGRRRGADEREAHARVLEHRARRLSARRPGRRQRGRQGRDPVLSGRLRRHEPRRVRRPGRALDATIGRTTTCATSPGCGTSGRAWRAADGVPAVARRLPADRRLHREVVHLQRRRAGGPDRARRPRRADERRLGLLLPAHRRA